MKVYIVEVSYETGAYDDRKDHVDTLHVFLDEQKAIKKVAAYESNPFVEDIFDEDDKEVKGIYYHFAMEVE